MDVGRAPRRSGRAHHGFTLVELMVVVLVLAILLAVGIPTYFAARRRSQDSAARTSLATALTAAWSLGPPPVADPAALAAAEPALGFTRTVSTGAEVVSVAAGAEAVYAVAASASGSCIGGTQDGHGRRFTTISGTCEVAGLVAPTVDDTITTFAGNGSGTASGDGGPATAAGIGPANGLAVAPDGTVYVTSYYMNTVRRIAPDGTITTVAGTGTAGFSGDGGPATAAQLNGPVFLELDTTGRLLIGDRNNGRIRRVALDGTISTFVSGLSSSVDGLVFAPDGNLYAADTATNHVLRIDPTGTVTNVATVPSPYGIALAPDGSVVTATWTDHRVYRVTTDGTVTVLAGTGTSGASGDGGPATAATMNGPIGLAYDPIGRLFIGEYNGSRIRVVDTDGTISTWTAPTGGYSGDGGPMGSARVGAVMDLAFDPDGNLLISDTGNNRIRRVTR